MSSSTASKAQAKVTATEIHQAPASPSPQKHQPVRAPSYPDEKSHEYAVTIEPSPEDPPPSTPLQIFHSALGIPPPKPPKPVKPTKKNPTPIQEDKPRLTPKNEGVYNKVLACERSARWKYLLLRLQRHDRHVLADRRRSIRHCFWRGEFLSYPYHLFRGCEYGSRFASRSVEESGVAE